MEKVGSQFLSKALREADETPGESLSKRELVNERLAKIVVHKGRLEISLNDPKSVVAARRIIAS